MIFSIIIPCYNTEQYLRETLESVLAQSFGDWEAVCVDDGSTDGTGLILDEYASRDARIKVVHQENGGEGAARNSALKVACGDWIVFLDSDDLITPWALASYAEMIRQVPNADMLALEMKCFHDGEGVPCVEKNKREINSVNIVDLRRKIDSGIVSISFTCAAVRRSLLNGIAFERFVIGSDRVFFCSCLCRAERLALTGVLGYWYRFRDTSAMHSRLSLKKIQSMIDYPFAIMDIFSLSGRTIDSRVFHEFASAWMECIPYVSRQLPGQERKEARSYWREALPRMRRIRNIPAWFRFTSIVCQYLPFSPVINLLCCCPYWLKQKGIHR